MEENNNYMDECGICFKKLNNNLILSGVYDDNNNNNDSDNDNNNDSDSDNDNNNYNNVIVKKKYGFIYNPIRVNLLECKTDKCYFKLCNDCKKVYYLKYKNKFCPNCREKIENIDQIIQNLEEQKENTNQSLI